MKRAAAWLYPDAGGEPGVLPAALVVLTVVSGIVDAVSFLGLGNVFVANMTGNVVFVGFAVAGAQRLSLWAAASAVVSFVLGAWLTGRVRVPLAAVTGAHAAMVVPAVVLLAAYGPSVVVIMVLAFGMGMQNASVRRAGVPDMTTTVLTTALTGLAADSPGTANRRRAVSIAALFTGALAGGSLYRGIGPAVALSAAAVLLVAVTVVLARES
ncbi:YoaK family protein [Nonomuraea typhae]|uniref:YoaK family protein n=1 Tax=Nonomuraea typhae TaxID=2603600 RepID=A0ABW7YVZ2_9ACTN